MSWRARYLKGSFKGVPFHVADDEVEGGKRVVVHEYPGRDDPATEEFGRRGRRFAVRGYTIGANYDLQLAALALACETGGAGALVLPQQGIRFVHCTYVLTRTTNQEGGFGTIDMEFVEAGGVPGPTATVNPLAVLTSAIVAAGDALRVLGDR